MLLIVEGKNDYRLIESILVRQNARSEVQINPVDSIAKVLNTTVIRAALSTSEIRGVGLVFDADDNPRGHWASFVQHANNCGYSAEREPRPNGVVLAKAGAPSLGAWMMPANDPEGTLEDFARRLIPKNDPLVQHAEASVAAIPIQPPPFAHRTGKAIIHTWLAWQEEPGRPMGTAITKRYLDSNLEAAQSFVAWVQSLRVQ